MKFSKSFLAITVLLLSTITLYSIKYLYTENANTIVSNNKPLFNNQTVSKSIDYSDDGAYISKYLDIEVKLDNYHILTNDEMIEYLGLGKDYYTGDTIDVLLKNGANHYELIANAYDNNSSISIIISKPKIIPSIKDLKALYDEDSIKELTTEYESNGFKSVLIKPYTKDFLEEECFILDSSYIDQDNNLICLRSIYLSNDKYQGIIKLMAKSMSKLNQMEGYFNKYETDKS